MKSSSFFLIFATFILVIIGANSFFIINEKQKGLILKFSKVHRDAENNPVVYEPGLHYKLPFIEKPVVIEKRIQTMDGMPDVVTTSEKEYVEVDTYVQWRVENDRFGQFYLRTSGDSRRAEDALERLVDDALRQEFGKYPIKEAISSQRKDMMENIRKTVNDKTLEEYGIEVVDIRVKKVNYTKEVVQNVYNQIISERKAKAIAIRSEGQQKANIISAETDADVKKIKAEADEFARTLRGKADAEVAEIYATTYKKAPEFYTFLRSLDAYKSSFSSKDDVLVIKPDSEFFKYLKDAKGE
jgi:membrane protease subunit HflC